MIIIKYRGGLGNQMFQYAFQLAMQKHYTNAEVLADISHYHMLNEHNGFELCKVFNIKLAQAEYQSLKKVSPYYVPTQFYEKLPKKLQELIAHNLQYKYYERQKKHKADQYYRQKYHNTFEPKVFELSMNQDWYMDGLWQDIQYFKGCESEIRTAFQFRNVDRYSDFDRQCIEQISGSNSVGIHVRRGDFVNSKFDICSMDYYKNAIRIISEKVENPKFFFFTDDAEYVEKEFRWMENKLIIKHAIKDSILDMEMLSGCCHKIISNSTFAYWSAWLGTRDNALIIAPKYSVIKDEKKFELVIPEQWVQI